MAGLELQWNVQLSICTTSALMPSHMGLSGDGPCIFLSQAQSSVRLLPLTIEGNVAVLLSYIL